jgi:hypothetical protein
MAYVVMQFPDARWIQDIAFGGQISTLKIRILAVGFIWITCFKRFTTSPTRIRRSDTSPTSLEPVRACFIGPFRSGSEALW